MKLSMWMLADQLSQYHPEADIRSGERCLQSARLFTEDMNLSPFSVYVEQIETQRVVATNHNDILTFHSDDVNGVLNDILNIFEYYYLSELAFESAIAQGCSSLELLRLFAEKTGYYFIFADATFFMHDFCGPEEIHSAQPNLRQTLHRQMLPPLCCLRSSWRKCWRPLLPARRRCCACASAWMMAVPAPWRKWARASVSPVSASAR